MESWRFGGERRVLGEFVLSFFSGMWKAFRVGTPRPFLAKTF